MKQSKEENQKEEIIKFLKFRQEQGKLDIDESINYVWNTAQNFTHKRNVTGWMMLVLVVLLSGYITYNKVSIMGQIKAVQDTVIERCVTNESK